MTLRDKVTADAQTVFLQTGHWAEEIELWPLGDRAQAIPVVAVVDWDTEQGESSGFKYKLTPENHGRAEDRYVAVELLSTVQVNHRDAFLLTDPNGQQIKANAVRRIGADSGMQTWLALAPRGIDTKHTRIRN